MNEGKSKGRENKYKAPLLSALRGRHCLFFVQHLAQWGPGPDLVLLGPLLIPLIESALQKAGKHVYQGDGLGSEGQE